MEKLFLLLGKSAVYIFSLLSSEIKSWRAQEREKYDRKTIKNPVEFLITLRNISSIVEGDDGTQCELRSARKFISFATLNAQSAHGNNLISLSITKCELTYFLAHSFIKLVLIFCCNFHPCQHLSEITFSAVPSSTKEQKTLNAVFSWWINYRRKAHMA